MTGGIYPQKGQKKKLMNDQDKESAVHICVSVSGQPAVFLKEIRQRGLVVSNHDAIIQALLALQERVINLDLKKAEVEKLRVGEE